MRMWGVDPRVMCVHHLLGEHKELHMLVGAIEKSTSLAGYIRNRLIDVTLLEPRHEELVQEFKRRNWPSGLNHLSPLKLNWDWVGPHGSIDIDANLVELRRRCSKCLELQESVVMT